MTRRKEVDPRREAAQKAALDNVNIAHTRKNKARAEGDKLPLFPSLFDYFVWAHDLEFTQEDMSTDLDVSRATVNRWINELCKIKLEKKERIA